MQLQRRQLAASTAANCLPSRVCRVAAPCRKGPSVSQAAVPAPYIRNLSPIYRSTHKKSRDVYTCAIEASQALGVALFFAPSIIAVIYAYFKGKGNVKDGLSRMLTEFSQGYFQPNVGGKNIPVAQGELSDLAGDEPLFKALYQW